MVRWSGLATQKRRVIQNGLDGQPRRDCSLGQSGSLLPQGMTYQSISSEESDGTKCFFTKQGLSFPAWPLLD